MSKKEFKLPTAKCKRCGHTWTPRTAHVRICPKCKSPYWDVARQSEAKEEKPSE